MGRSVNQKESFLSPCLCYGINLRENSYTIWMPCTSQGFWKSPFPSPSRKHTFAGIPLKTPSIRKTGALISKKHSMDLAMQSNILDAIPTRLLSLTAGSFLSRKSKNLKLIFKLQGYQKFKQRYASLGMTDLLRKSCIDHIYIKRNMVDKCENMIVHNKVKFSDHYPITFCLNIWML